MPQTIDNMSAIWSNSLTTYTFLKTNITGPSGGAEQSAAGSLLMDLQVGGSSRFNVSKAGTVSSAASGAGAAAFSATNFKIYSNTYFSVESGGGIAMTLERNVSTGLRVGSQMPIGWSSATDAWNNSPDLCLTRRAVANLRFGVADTGAVSATVTITIAAPGVVTWSGHNFSTGTPVVFTTTGALPTGITAGTTYYAVVVDANTIQLATSVANAISATPTVITTSGSQSGTHTGTRYNITQRLSIQGITGVADRLGADLIIQGSQGTGTGAGGSIVFQVAPAGSSGTAQNALATALTIDSTRLATFEGRVASRFGYTFGSPQFYDASLGSGTGFGVVGAQSCVIYANNTAVAAFEDGGNGIRLSGSRSIGWVDGHAIQGSADVRLWRDAANTLALRNGGTSGTPVPQTFNIYNWTDGTNFERASLGWATNNFQILVNAGGTGNQRGMQVGMAGSGGFINFWAGTPVWQITSGGVLQAVTDNQYDIGASGANRPRSIYTANSVFASGNFYIGTGSDARVSSAGFVANRNNTGYFAWAASNATGASDTGIYSEAAGVVSIRGANSTTGGSLGLIEQTAPAAPATNGVRIYAEDNGSGKTRLMALFATGAAVQIAIEP